MNPVNHFLRRRSAKLHTLLNDPSTSDILDFVQFEDQETDLLQKKGLIEKSWFKYDNEDEQSYIKMKCLESGKVYVLNVEMGDDIETTET